MRKKNNARESAKISLAFSLAFILQIQRRTRKEYGSLDGFFDVLRRDAFYSAALKL